MHSPSESGRETQKVEKKPQPTSPEQPREAFDERAFQEKNLALQTNLRPDFEDVLRNVTKRMGLNCESPKVTIDLSKASIDEEKEWTPKKIRDNPEMVFCFTLNASIDRKNGAKVISFNRTFFYDKASQEWIVFRWGQRVVEDLQGKGMASEIGRAEEDAYRREGISEILLWAGHISGTYYNAAQGFDFADPEIKTRANAKLLSLILDQNIQDVRLKGSDEKLLPIRKELSAQEISQLQAFGDDGQDVKIMATRPDIKNGERLKTTHQEKYSLGKAFLLDTGLDNAFPNGWEGKKRL